MQTLAQPGTGFDLVVVGGGIVGAGIAAQAARLGLRVALLERGDFAGATSSASSKLVHGGLRYLRMGDVRLVREALAEARVLRSLVAPHLVRELDFVLPVYRDGPWGPLAIRAALAAYGTLGGRRAHVVGPARAAELVPPLRHAGLRAAGLYADAQTDDARLCLANVRAAADDGALVASRVEVVGLERSRRGVVVHAHDRRSDAALELEARSVVNAAGAAVDEVRRLEDPSAGTSVVLSKGAHLVLEPQERWDAALTIPVDRTRVSFAIPWNGLLLLGTTDDELEPGVEADTVDEREERQILAEAARALPAEALRPEAIRARFAGVRVLPLGRGSTARARREIVLSRGRLGVLSVAGGKLTTYRPIAAAVLRSLGVRGVPAAPFPLPGAADVDAVAASLPVDPGLARHLARTYGSLAAEVVALAETRPDGLEPVVDGAPEVVAQVVYARTREWAVTADDVLRRRTTLALRGLASAEVRERVQSVLDDSGVAV